MDRFARLPHRILQDDQLTRSARLLCVAIDKVTDKKTGYCQPSVNELAGMIGISERQVYRLLDELEDEAIEISRKDGKRNSYRVLWVDCPQRGDMGVTPLLDVTPDIDVTPPLTPMSPLCGIPPCSGIKELKERTSDPHPQESKIPKKKQPGFWDAEDRQQVRIGVAYLIAEQPNLASFADWFPEAFADFCLGQSWNAKSDPDLGVFWAKQFQHIEASKDDIVAALSWATVTPLDVWSRKDLRYRIIGRIQSIQKQRKLHAETLQRQRERSRVDG